MSTNATQFDVTTAVQVFLAIGVGSFFVDLARRLLSRKKDKIDAAASIQEAALELLSPMRERIHELEEEAAKLRDTVKKLRDEGNELVEWARMAKRELDIRGAQVAPIPLRRANGGH